MKPLDRAYAAKMEAWHKLQKAHKHYVKASDIYLKNRQRSSHKSLGITSDLIVYHTITEVAEACGKSRQWFYDRIRLGNSLPPAEHNGYGRVWWEHLKVAEWFQREYPTEASGLWSDIPQVAGVGTQPEDHVRLADWWTGFAKRKKIPILQK
tara:strand:+ start:1618 stop:2073 length:456 start_codon:yes stop_codon:yes gene_type:complete